METFYKLNGSKYAINHDFFESIDTEEKAYLLGFYVADGNVNEKRKTLRIKIQESDSEIINMYSKFISPDSRVRIIEGYEIKGRGGKIYLGKSQICLDINSATLVKSLVNLGFGYQKTYSELSMLSIRDDLKIHFIRGYFDGDGCITSWLSKEKGKKDRMRTKVDFCNKHKNLLMEIQSYLKINNISFNLNYLKRDDMFRISSSSKVEILKLKDLFYKNATLFLNRKRIKFDNVNSEIL